MCTGSPKTSAEAVLTPPETSTSCTFDNFIRSARYLVTVTTRGTSYTTATVSVLNSNQACTVTASAVGGGTAFALCNVGNGVRTLHLTASTSSLIAYATAEPIYEF